MLEGEDRPSYELTLAALAHHLHDAHIYFRGALYFAHMFGRYYYPAQLVYAEGQLVVYSVASGSSLARGDAIIGVNGRNIDEITSEMRRFLSYPNEEKALAYLARHRRGEILPTGAAQVVAGQGTHRLMRPGIPHALTAHEGFMFIDILRGRFGNTYRVSGSQFTWMYMLYTFESHVLLDSNIGIINSAVQADVHYIMESFADTYGILVDLRQQPHAGFEMAILQHLLEEPVPYLYFSKPSPMNPGRRFNVPKSHIVAQDTYRFIYGRPVVLLTDLQTFGAPERVAMSLSAAPNVTVIGPYSMGSGGKVSILPLPGGIDMFFTSLGVYTPEGGQTFRLGLTPDIRVERTVQGVTEGRDEIMEAAIEFILGER